MQLFRHHIKDLCRLYNTMDLHIREGLVLLEDDDAYLFMGIFTFYFRVI